jgi:hypothetical protein
MALPLTQERLKQIIKEELEVLMSEIEETSPEDAKIASLERQLAEAKKEKMKKGKMSGNRSGTFGTKKSVANTGSMKTVKPTINANAGKTGKAKK